MLTCGEAWVPTKGHKTGNHSGKQHLGRKHAVWDEQRLVKAPIAREGTTFASNRSVYTAR